MPLKGHKAHLRRLRKLSGAGLGREVGKALFAAGEKIQVEAQLSITRGVVSGKSHTPARLVRRPTTTPAFWPTTSKRYALVRRQFRSPQTPRTARLITVELAVQILRQAVEVCGDHRVDAVPVRLAAMPPTPLPRALAAGHALGFSGPGE